MKDIQLFGHNEEAYKKLYTMLQKEQFASVDHSTGTGKSFILLKYLYTNCAHKRILYIAPTYHIINQLTKKQIHELGLSMEDFCQFDAIIYQTLLKMNPDKIVENYDMIVFDEYHRAGAPKTFEVIKEVMGKLKKYPEKKVIGLTATEIRYLDHERNMNQIIFNGQSASKLSLADAIIKGLLPVPRYYCLPFSMLSDISKMRKIIDTNFLWTADYENIKKEIDDLEQEIKSFMFNNDEIREFIKSKNNFVKILAFSNRTSDIYGIKKINKSSYDEKSLLFKKRITEKFNIDFTDEVEKDFIEKSDNENVSLIGIDKRFVRHILGSSDIKEYAVDFTKGKKKNEAILDEFANSTSGINVLYSINLLSEGVHVPGIDALIMLRKTKSPIIYLQHLGRALSYSSKDRDVYVFDAANNVRGNQAIIDLYDELFKRLEVLIAQNDENKERYERIKERLKIVNLSEKSIKKYETLKSLIKSDRFVVNKLERAKNILLGYFPSTYIEKEYARIIVLKYQEYINRELFIELKNSGLFNQGIFSQTIDSFTSNLSGFKNLKDYYQHNINMINSKISDYIKKKGSVPYVLSTNEEDKKMYELIASSYKFLDSSLKNEIREIIKNDENAHDIDRLVYLKIYQVKNKNEFLSDLEEAIKNNAYLPDKIFKVYNLINEGVNLSKPNNSLNERLAYSSFYEEVLEKETVIINKLGEYDATKKFTDEYISFIKHNRLIPRLNAKNKKELALYTKYLIYNDLLDKTNFRKKINYVTYILNPMLLEHKKMTLMLQEYYRINGSFPDKKIKDSKTNDLLEYFEKYTENLSDEEVYSFKSEISSIKVISSFEELVDFINDNDGIPPSQYVKEEEAYYNKLSSLTDDEKTKIDVVFKKHTSSHRRIIDAYINFIKENLRYPLPTSPDEKEVELIYNFNAIFNFLPNDIKSEIKQIKLRYRVWNIDKNTLEANISFQRGK